MGTSKRERSPLGKKITRKEIRDALAQLNELCAEEYGSDITLDRVLFEPDSHRGKLRLQRLTGIVLKRPFARAGGPSEFSATGARRSWEWVAIEPNEDHVEGTRDY